MKFVIILKKKFLKRYFQEDVKKVDKDNLKVLIKQLTDLYKYVESNKKKKLTQ